MRRGLSGKRISGKRWSRTAESSMKGRNGLRKKVLELKDEEEKLEGMRMELEERIKKWEQNAITCFPHFCN